jgi:hypothetical protein
MRVCGALIGIALVSPLLLAQQTADRGKPPALGPAPQLHLPAIERRTLGNGLAVWLIESHEVPLVQVNLVVKAGSGDDPAGKFGLASLTAAMLDEARAPVRHWSSPTRWSSWAPTSRPRRPSTRRRCV